jgi:hypothetical protein
LQRKCLMQKLKQYPITLRVFANLNNAGAQPGKV